MQDKTTDVHLVLIGDAQTGKTTLANFLVGQPLPSRYVSTIGMNSIDYILGDCRIQLEDTGGQKRFHPYLLSYFEAPEKRVDGVMVCIDLSKNHDVQNMNFFLGLARKVTKNIVVVGTKRDQLNSATQMQVEALCHSSGYFFMAINPYDVEDAAKRQVLWAQVIKSDLTEAEQDVQGQEFSIHVAVQHFQDLLASDQKYEKYREQLIKELSGDIQAFQHTYLKNSGYSVPTQWIIANHYINLFSIVTLLCGVGVLGIAVAQISPLVGLVVAASSLFIAAVAEQHMAAKTGHLFGFFSPLDSAAANLMHTCRAEYQF